MIYVQQFAVNIIANGIIYLENMSLAVKERYGSAESGRIGPVHRFKRYSSSENGHKNCISIFSNFFFKGIRAV